MAVFVGEQLKLIFAHTLSYESLKMGGKRVKSSLDEIITKKRET